MYVTRHDWLYHEMQIHRRRWICSGDCGLSFATKDAMESHMRSSHPNTFTELQLPVILDICERPADPNSQALCSLCPAEMTLSKLLLHLATHLEELPLFVLPISIDESGKSQKSGSNQGASGIDDSRLGDLPSLGAFSATEMNLPDTDNQLTSLADIREGGVAQDSAVEVQSWLKEEVTAP